MAASLAALWQPLAALWQPLWQPYGSPLAYGSPMAASLAALWQPLAAQWQPSLAALSALSGSPMAALWQPYGSPLWHPSGTSVAVVVLSVAPQWHLVEWLLVEFPARRHPDSCPGPPGSWITWFSRPCAVELGLMPPPAAPDLRRDTVLARRSDSGSTAVVKRHFSPAKSFIRARVTSRGTDFSRGFPRLPIL